MKKLLLTLTALITLGSSPSIFATIISNKTELPIHIEWSSWKDGINHTFSKVINHGEEIKISPNASVTMIGPADENADSLNVYLISLKPGRIELVGMKTSGTEKE